MVCNHFAVVHAGWEAFEWTLCFRDHFFGILSLGIVALLSWQLRTSHNVLTDHWATTGYRNYRPIYAHCVYSCAVGYICMFPSIAQRLQTSIGISKILFIFLLCFDAKVRLNFGCFGKSWGYSERSQLTPRCMTVVASQALRREILQGRYESDYCRRRKKNIPAIRWVSRFQSIVAECFSVVQGDLSCAKVASVCVFFCTCMWIS